MELHVHSRLRSLVEGVVDAAIKSNPFAAKALSGMELSVGPSSDPSFATDVSALGSPCFVGDSMWVGDSVGLTPQMEALFKQSPERVGLDFRWNSGSKRFDRVYSQKGIGDAAPNLIGAQLLGANLVSWIAKPFKQPLTWSRALDMVSRVPGTDPWAVVMDWALQSYGGGWAQVASAGAPNNQSTQDVEVMTGLMTSQIINITVSYRLTVEEMQRNNSNVPYAGQLIAEKQKYANWVIDMVKCVLTYYGNASTDTKGLLTAAGGATAWTGDTLSEINAGSSTTKGSDMYAALASVVRTFMNANQNKLTTIKVGMSPLAFNFLNSVAYSANYNPQSPLRTFAENFLSGMGKEGITPSVDFVADPLLSGSGASNPWNSLASDYLIITSPEIKGGADDQPQPLVAFGEALDKFVYPVVPGQYATQYKTLSRVAGVFAPYTPGIKVYSGFGIDA